MEKAGPPAVPAGPFAAPGHRSKALSLGVPGRQCTNEFALLSVWPKYRSFIFSISPSNECSGLISFRVDWLDLLAVKVTLKSLLQHHNQKHQFFSAQHFLWSNLTYVYDYWKNLSFDYADLCRLSYTYL